MKREVTSQESFECSEDKCLIEVGLKEIGTFFFFFLENSLQYLVKIKMKVL